MIFGIDRYIGTWANEDGFRLEIRKIDETHASVSLFSNSNQLILRPYWDGKETKDMPADYDDYMGYFDVQLWEPGREFCLNLSYEYSTRIDDQGEEILVPSLTRYEKDDHLDVYYPLFGSLKRYKRIKRWKNS